MELALFHPYRIRSFEKGDETAMVRYANNREVSRTLRDSFPFPYRKSDAQAWLKLVRQQEPEINFAIANDEELIGGIGLRFFSDVYRGTAELGYWLGEPFWGRGIASAAVKKFSPYCFERYDIVRLTAGVFEGNNRSCRVLEKAGFALEGRQRRAITKDETVLDEIVYGLAREDVQLLSRK